MVAAVVGLTVADDVDLVRGGDVVARRQLDHRRHLDAELLDEGSGIT